MHFIESGTGLPLVLLHAFPVDARMWNGARVLLEEQAKVITPDQRGLGESPLPEEAGSDAAGEPQPPSMDVVAADVLAMLDTLGIQRAVLGGCSMGGYAAMAVLCAAPERVAGLLLIDTKAEADGAQQRENRLAAAQRAEREGTRGWLAENSLQNVLGGTTLQSRPNVVSEVRGMIEAQDPAGVAWAQRAMAGRPDSRSMLRGFSGPVLVVAGEQDAMTSPEDARELAAELPAGEFAALPEVGHLSPVEDPSGFAETVGPWLRRIA